MTPRKFSEIMENVNGRLERLMPVLTPSGIVLGFLLPGVFIHLRPLITALFSMITLSGALKLRVREIGQTLRNPLPIPPAFFSIHILMPLAALLVSSLFFKDDPDTVAGFSLLYSGPTAVSGVIWVSMFKGDNALCLTLILLAPIVVPGAMSLLMGARVAMNMSGITASLVLMVVIPTVIGITANETSRGKIPALVCPYVTPLSKICIVLVIAANTSAVARRRRAGLVIFEKPGNNKISPKLQFWESNR
jgi:tagaturonate reductase